MYKIPQKEILQETDVITLQTFHILFIFSIPYLNKTIRKLFSLEHSILSYLSLPLLLSVHLPISLFSLLPLTGWKFCFPTCLTYHIVSRMILELGRCMELCLQERKLCIKQNFDSKLQKKHWIENLMCQWKEKHYLFIFVISSFLSVFWKKN